ncbi:hypothetical protein ON010_g12851 [Phytophthora cinnamomi]|nr:hypothetical protein ON010_g12851 [Phytophthora cinnamomi]
MADTTLQGVITAKWKDEADFWDVEAENANEEEEHEEEESDSEQAEDDGEQEGAETELLPRIRPSALTPDGKKTGGRVQLPRVQLVDPQSVARQRGRYPNAGDVWLAVGCYYAAYMSYRAAYTDLSREQYAKASRQPACLLVFLFAFAMSGAAGLAVSILTTWHIYLIFTAQFVLLDLGGAADQSPPAQSPSSRRKSGEPV